MNQKEKIIFRYGENPHQKAEAENTEHGGVRLYLEELDYCGKALSYNNILDAEAAFKIMLDMRGKSAVSVMKHLNPCGLATGETLSEAFRNACYGDEVSKFGAVIGFSQRVTKDVIELIGNQFVEVLVAPSYDWQAIEWIRSNSKQKNRIRAIHTGPLENALPFREEHTIRGWKLSQTEDDRLYLCDTVDELLGEPKRLVEPNSGLKYNVGRVTKAKFEDGMQGLIEFSIIASKHTKSNALVLAYEYAKGQYSVLGMGAGQPNRMDSGKKLALTKARENLTNQYIREHKLNLGMIMCDLIEDNQFRVKFFDEIKSYIDLNISSNKCILAGDAFFPKVDGVIKAAELGVKYIVSPGGSNSDKEVVDAANKYGVAMIFTGIRHFKHLI